VTWAGGIALAALGLVCACGDAPPPFSAPQTLGGVEVSAETLNRGQRIFNLYCASCHGDDGSGQGPAARGLQTQPRDFRGADFKYVSGEPGSLPTDSDLEATIRNGRVQNGMPAWNGLTDIDRLAVVQYLKTFSPRWTQ
jgi:mono/diheme cytochrome c family protein